MAIAGVLALNLEARTAKLEADLKKARSEIARYANRVKRMGNDAEKASSRGTRSFARMSVSAKGLRTSIVSLSNSMKGMAAVVVGGLALGKLGDLMHNIDVNIGKVSARLGVSVEAFQEFEFAASQAGVAQDQLADGMKDILIKAQDAINGQKGFADLFKKVGLSMEELKTLDQEEIFKRTIFGAAKLKDGLFVLDELASDAGVALLLMGRAGEKSFNAVRKKARDMGAIMTANMVKQIEDANKQIDMMSRVIRANFAPLITKIVPHITEFGISFANVVNALFGTNEQLKNLTDREKQVVKTLKLIRDFSVGIKDNFFKAVDGIAQFIGELTGTRTQAPLDAINARIAQLRGQIKQAKHGLASILPKALGGKTEDDIAILERRLENALSARQVIKEEIARQAKEGVVDGVKQAQESLANIPLIPPAKNLSFSGPTRLSNEEYKMAAIEAEKTIRKFRDKLEEEANKKAADRARDRVEQLREREEAHAAAISRRYSELVDENKLKFDDISEKARMAMERVSTPAILLRTVAEGIGNAFNNAFQGVLQGTQSLGDAFKNMFRTIIQSLAQLAIQFAIMQAILLVLSAIPGGQAVLKAMDAAALAGSIGSGATAALQMSQNRGETPRAMAGGGVVTQPTLALLGENPATTPEVVMNRQQMENMNREVTVILVDDRVSAARLQASLPGAIIRTVSENMMSGRGNPLNRAVRQGLS